MRGYHMLVLVCFVLIVLLLMPLFSVRLRQEKASLASLSPESRQERFCLTGAFIADNPTREDIDAFKEAFGKKPYLVMIFIDWDNFFKPEVTDAIVTAGCLPVITWEPWKAKTKEPIDYAALLAGEDDEYIISFAQRIKDLEKTVYLRFAHEMNGNWYPWSGAKITAAQYQTLYRYVKDVFDAQGVKNVKWIFSVNGEDVPATEENFFFAYYPGDSYVDFVGIDGYNWGATQSWSSWSSFETIFRKRYEEIRHLINKPIMISEFGSTARGGDKAQWIRQAMDAMKAWAAVKAFILFNVNKEVDWQFSVSEPAGQALKKALEDSCFKEDDF